MNRNRLKALFGMAVLGGTLGTVAGCATSPVPNEKMAVAAEAVQRAEQNGAPQSAPVQLDNAKEKLAKARKASADGHGPQAEQLADQATVDAQLAEATAAQVKSDKAAAEFDASMAALRREANQNTQPIAPVTPRSNP